MRSLLLFLAILLLGLSFYSYSFLITLFVISFLIFFHELGHFLAARAVGIRVEIFSIGFGKPFFEKEIKDTKYRLCALLFGGYVKLKGQDDLNPNELSSDKDSYRAKSPLQRIFVLFAGPFFNFLLAFLIYFLVANLGINKFAPIIGKVMPDSAAFKAGLLKNDEIISINSEKILSFDEITKHLSLKPATLLIKRGEKLIKLSITPKNSPSFNDFGERVRKPMLGISPKGDLIKVYHLGLDGLDYALSESTRAASLIFIGLKKLLSNELSPSNLGGIITMVDITSKASATSFITLCLITALISINLGVLNLLPIPALDGGHILFNLYELIFKKPFPQKLFEILSYIGIFLLLALMIFATYNDFLRIQVAPINGFFP